MGVITSLSPAPNLTPTNKPEKTSTRESPWYTFRDVARLYSLSKRSVWRWEDQGRIPKAVRRGKRWTRWRKDEVDRHLAAMTGDR